MANFLEDAVFEQAARLAFYYFLGIFPAVLLLLVLLNTLPVPDLSCVARSAGIMGLMALAAMLYGSRAGTAIGRHLGVQTLSPFPWRVTQWLVIAILLLFSFARSIASGQT